MSTIQIHSVSTPFDDRRCARLGIQILTRAAAMGILERGKTISRLDANVWRDALARIRKARVGRRLALSIPEGDDGREAFARQLVQLDEALVASPVPMAEGPKLDLLLSRKLLTRLLGIAAVSLQRYLSGERAMPDAVAARLHFLALVVGNLSGAYNDIGVRRWFDRRRTLLDGHSPAELLASGWQPEDEGPRCVRDLAHSLVWSPAT